MDLSEQSHVEWFLPKKRKRLTEEEKFARKKAKEDAKLARETERKAKEEAKKAAKEAKQAAREAKKAELAAKKPGKRGRKKKSTEVSSSGSIEPKPIRERKKRKGTLSESEKCHVCGQRKETGSKQGLEHFSCSSCSSSYCGTCYLKYFPKHRLIRDCPICAGNCDCIQCHQDFNTFEWHVRCVLKQYDAIIYQRNQSEPKTNNNNNRETQILSATRDLLIDLLSNAATNNRVVIPEPSNPYTSTDSSEINYARQRASDRDYKKKVTQVDSSCHICRTRHEGKRTEINCGVPECGITYCLESLLQYGFITYEESRSLAMDDLAQLNFKCPRCKDQCQCSYCTDRRRTHNLITAKVPMTERMWKLRQLARAHNFRQDKATYNYIKRLHKESTLIRFIFSNICAASNPLL